MTRQQAGRNNHSNTAIIEDEFVEIITYFNKSLQCDFFDVGTATLFMQRRSGIMGGSKWTCLSTVLLHACTSPNITPIMTPNTHTHTHPHTHTHTLLLYALPFTLMNEQWRAAIDVLVIVVTERVAVATPRLKIHGIYSTTLSAWTQ